MAIDPDAQKFLDLLASAPGPALVEMTPEEARGLGAIFMDLTGPGPDMAAERDIEIPAPHGSIPARVYEPVADPPGTIVWYHGGGWVVGGLDDNNAVCRHLAEESGSRLVSVDYRLAPEHRFPAAADDAYAALVWLAGNVADGKPIVVGGDSAGGNLAAIVSQLALADGGPAIALQLLVYPVVDHDMTTASYQEFDGDDLLLNKREMVWFWNHYAPEPADRDDPKASPLRAESLAGLPAAFVVIAGNDPLRDEGLAYAEALEASGVPVSVARFDGQIHAFFTIPNFIPTGNTAIAEAGAAVREAVAAHASA
jgi:acetyl esterase